MNSRYFIVPAVLACLSLSVCIGADAGVAELIKKGDALDAQLKTKAALETFLEAEKLAPNNAELLRRIAKEYDESMVDVSSKEEKKRLAELGLTYAKRAVAAEPENATAQLALAICYGRVAPYLDSKTKIGYSKLVKLHTDKALALDPNNDYAHHVLGAWNYELANLGGLLRTVAKLIYGEIPAASNEDAVAHFKKAIDLMPQRVAHHVELGRTYAAMGKTDLARVELTKGLSLPSREKDDPDSKARAKEALGKL